MTANPAPIPYFVTGLPRSRTAWWSVLLSRSGGLCDHESELLSNTQDDWFEYYHRRPEGGNSSALLLYSWRKVREEFPLARWLILERDPDEALEAAVASCKEAGMEREIRRSWPTLVAELQALKAELPPGLKHIISQESMDDYFQVAGAYTHLTKRPLEWEWFRHMNRLKVTVQEYALDDASWLRDLAPLPKRITSLELKDVRWSDTPVRLFTDSDIPMMESWTQSHLGHGITRERIPPLGVVVHDEEGNPAAMLFAQLAVDRPVAYLEDPVSRPGMIVGTTVRHFKEGIEALKAALTALGYDVLIANTSPPFARVLRSWGWDIREEGLIKLETATI